MEKNEGSTIERCPHDGENPYAQISRDLIRNENLSPNCRWMLTYLLSMKDGWKISVKQIWSHTNKFLGRDKIYSLMQEAIDAGYMRKEIVETSTLRRGVKYFLSEHPKYKKDTSDSNNSSGFLNTRIPTTRVPEIRNLKEEHHSLPKEEHIKESLSISLPVESVPPPFEEIDLEIAKELWTCIQKAHPKQKPPSLEDWAKTVSKARKIDDRTPDDLRAVIRYSFEKNDFWSRTLQSAKGLRKHFDTIFAKMRPPTTSDARQQTNLQTAIKIKGVLGQSNEEYLLTIMKKGVMFQNGESLSFDLPEETFRDVLVNRFNLRVKKNE